MTLTCNGQWRTALARHRAIGAQLVRGQTMAVPHVCISDCCTQDLQPIFLRLARLLDIRIDRPGRGFLASGGTRAAAEPSSAATPGGRAPDSRSAPRGPCPLQAGQPDEVAKSRTRSAPGHRRRRTPGRSAEALNQRRDGAGQGENARISGMVRKERHQRIPLKSPPIHHRRYEPTRQRLRGRPKLPRQSGKSMAAPSPLN